VLRVGVNYVCDNNCQSQFRVGQGQIWIYALKLIASIIENENGMLRLSESEGDLLVQIVQVYLLIERDRSTHRSAVLKLESNTNDDLLIVDVIFEGSLILSTILERALGMLSPILLRKLFFGSDSLTAAQRERKGVTSTLMSTVLYVLIQESNIFLDDLISTEQLYQQSSNLIFPTNESACEIDEVSDGNNATSCSVNLPVWELLSASRGSVTLN
jgi:hypothetical protein